ncbi:MAG: thiamine diphosphokinase [Paracoccaceae bacterium]|jgi:thiamine pyrophosphokinase|nr:thiamine diphosphokinase [Paracoccaceae bacterium]
MIELKELGVTFLGGGELNIDDLIIAKKLAPKLIAADGAADLAIKNGFVPTAVIGDMDSISKDFFKQHLGILSLHEKEQETTDFDKCLRNVVAKFGIGVGFLGARIDHELAAFNSILTHSDYPVFLIGTQDVIFSCPSYIELNLPIGTRVSLFPLREVCVSAKGLVWNLKKELLSPLERIGTSNLSNLSRVSIETDNNGLLLILPKSFLQVLINDLVG